MNPNLFGARSCGGIARWAAREAQLKTSEGGRVDIQEIFKIMVEIEASDLYLTVARPPMYRVEGKIQAIGDKNFTPDGLGDSG